jgi:hypothetical protein
VSLDTHSGGQSQAIYHAWLTPEQAEKLRSRQDRQRSEHAVAPANIVYMKQAERNIRHYWAKLIGGPALRTRGQPRRIRSRARARSRRQNSGTDGGGDSLSDGPGDSSNSTTRWPS